MKKRVKESGNNSKIFLVLLVIMIFAGLIADLLFLNTLYSINKDKDLSGGLYQLNYPVLSCEMGCDEGYWIGGSSNADWIDCMRGCCYQECDSQYRIDEIAWAKNDGSPKGLDEIEDKRDQCARDCWWKWPTEIYPY